MKNPKPYAQLNVRIPHAQMKFLLEQKAKNYPCTLVEVVCSIIESARNSAQINDPMNQGGTWPAVNGVESD
jgi:hypothetical protein